MKTKRLLGFVAIAVASVGILAACGKDAAKDQTVVRVGTMAKSCLLYTSPSPRDS